MKVKRNISRIEIEEYPELAQALEKEDIHASYGSWNPETKELSFYKREIVVTLSDKEIKAFGL